MTKNELLRVMKYSDAFMKLFEDKENFTTSDFQGALDALILTVIKNELKLRSMR